VRDALGHAAVVFALGVGAIVFSEQLPGSVDAVMERAVGATLMALGAYVIISLVRHGRDFRMRSRWMLVIVGVRRTIRLIARKRAHMPQSVVIEHEHGHVHNHLHDHVHGDDAEPTYEQITAGVGPAQETVAAISVAPPSQGQMHRHRHRHAAAMPDDPFANYTVASALGIGALHGIGAETPTQVVIFVGAAGATGAGAGVLLLACFIVGLLASNTVVAATATLGFLQSSRRFPVYATVSVITAVSSLAIGALFLLGRTDVLPAILGG
jgi:hypothetical protein